MRIALVSPYSWTYPGGVTRHIEALAEELRRMGHDARILAPFDPDDSLTRRLHRGMAPQQCETPEDFVSLGRTVGIPANGAVSNLAVGSHALLTLRAELRSGAYDVAHIHEPVAPLVSWDAMCCAEGLPLVGTFHSYSENGLTNGIGCLLGAARRMNRLHVRIAVSEAAAWTARRFFGGRYRIVPNGVHLEPPLLGSAAAIGASASATCEPANGAAGSPGADGARFGPGTLRILFIGQAVERKGLPILLGAFEALRDELPATLTLVGAQPEDVAPLLLEGDGVRALGSVGEQQKLAELARADVLCAPSLHGESFGMVLTEAFAAGVPVVASDIPGYRDLVRHGREGMLVPPRDPVALAEALRAIALDRARRAMMAAAARERAERFGWSQVAAEVLDCYQQAMTVGRAPTHLGRFAVRYGFASADLRPRQPRAREPQAPAAQSPPAAHSPPAALTPTPAVTDVAAQARRPAHTPAAVPTSPALLRPRVVQTPRAAQTLRGAQTPGAARTPGIPEPQALSPPRPPRRRARALRLASLRRAALALCPLAGLGLGAAGLADIGVGRVEASLAASKPGLLTAGLGLMCAAMLARALAWHVILRAAPTWRRARLADALQGTFIGVLMSATLPVRLGEPSRALIVARRLGRVRETLPIVLGTLVSQMVLNLLAVITLGVVTLSSVRGVEGDRPLAVLAIMPVAALLALLLAPVIVPGARASRSFGPHDLWLEVRAALGRMRHGLRVFCKPRLAFLAVTTQLAAWGLQLLSCWLLLAALGLAERIGVAGAAAVLFAVNLTALLPLTPANVGLFQAAVVAVLAGVYDVSAATALAYGIVLQAIELATAFIMGLPALAKEGISWKELRVRTLHATPVRLDPLPARVRASDSAGDIGSALRG